MLQLSFTEEEIKELDYQRYHHPHPRVQRKMEALLLKAKGLPHHQIADCVWITNIVTRGRSAHRHHASFPCIDTLFLIAIKYIIIPYKILLYVYLFIKNANYGYATFNNRYYQIKLLL